MFKRLLSGWRSDAPRRDSGGVYVRPPTPHPQDTEIPRYPPFQQGLPVTEPLRLLSTQWDLVESIQHTLALEKSQFERLVMPVIERYAAFVHLLPASERHHHRLAGGLLRHGLEVAFWAARQAEGVVFAGGGTPLERKELEPRWRTAVCLAGLLHDIGKAAGDLHVTSADGRLTWRASAGSLYDWARQNNVQRYFLHWHQNRYGRHENISGFYAHAIVGDTDVFAWLSEPGPLIVHAIITSISGTASHDDRFARLVSFADSESTQRDLKLPQYSDQNDNPHAVPIERFLLDGMRRLLANGEWSINERGARVWHTDHGLFVVWKNACDDLRRLLERDGVRGIPHDPLTLAELLLARDLAVAFVDGNGEKYPTWPVAPLALDTPGGEPIVLRMLKLSGPHLLYSHDGPPIVPARIISTSPASVPTNESAPEPDSPAATALPERRIVIAPPPATPLEPPPAPDLPATIPIAKPGVDDIPLAQSPTQVNTRDTLPSTSVATLPGRAGEILMAMARDIASGKRAWGHALALVGDNVIVRYPDGLSDYGNAADILNALSEAGWIELDPMAPMKKVREREGVRGLILTASPARSVIDCAAPKRSMTDDLPDSGETRRSRRVSKPHTAEEASKQAALLVQLIRARDPETSLDITDQGSWLRVERAVISQYASEHTTLSLAQLRMAVEQRHDARLDADYLYVRKQLEL